MYNNNVKINKLEKFVLSSKDRYAKLGIDADTDVILPLTIGCNIGNYYCKNYSDFGRDLFKSAATLINEADGVNIRAGIKEAREDKVLEIDGSLFRVGIGDNMSGQITDRDPECMKAIAIYSIVKQLVKKKAPKKVKLIEVNLCVGLPLDEYNVEFNRNYLAKLFVGEYRVKYQGNDVIVSINKKFVRCTAEGYSHLQADAEKYFDLEKYEDVILNDVGSRTVDTCHLSEGSIINSESLTGYGTLDLIDSLKSPVSRATGIREVEEKRLEKMLRLGSAKVGTQEVALSEYSKIVNAYKNKVIGKIKQTHLNIDQADLIVFIGGGAYLFKDDLEKAFPTADVEFVPEAEFANAKAYYILALDNIK